MLLLATQKTCCSVAVHQPAKYRGCRRLSFPPTYGLPAFLPFISPGASPAFTILLLPPVITCLQYDRAKQSFTCLQYDRAKQSINNT